jgi:flagellar biosynthetic protein FliP
VQAAGPAQLAPALQILLAMTVLSLAPAILMSMTAFIRIVIVLSMVRQTREQDLALMVELAKAEQPASMDDIGMVQLIPAFMLSELRAAFQIGFVIFLPFLLVDLIVSSALMALGMMMVPPASISLPLKILMFVLMDGWNLVVRALLGTFS